MPNISNSRSIISAYSCRLDGNMSLKYGDTSNSLLNRKNFLGKLGIDYKHLVCAKQIHGANIISISDSLRGRGAEFYNNALDDCDGMITNIKGLPLAVFTADCLPIVLHDPKAGVAGIVHAGWKGSKEAIAAKAVSMMSEEFSSDPADIQAFFGPCIRECCYEVGGEFKNHFLHGLSRKKEKYFLDIGGVNKKQLIDAGLSGQDITDSMLCTSCESLNYFSFRREGPGCFRMMSVVMLRA